MCTCKVWVSLKPKAKVAFKVPFRFTKGPKGHPLLNKLSLRHIGLSDLETIPPHFLAPVTVPVLVWNPGFQKELLDDGKVTSYLTGLQH